MTKHLISRQITSRQITSRQIISRQIISRQITSRHAPLLLLAVGSATVLAGCGGGGDNGNTLGGGNNNNGGSNSAGNNNGGNNGGNNNGGVANSSIIGKVTDVQGNGLPGVSIAVDTGGNITQTLATGGFRLSNLTGNVVHKLTATVTQNNVAYSGSTQVLTDPGNLVSNANILLSRTDQQATVTGIVKDSTGAPVAGAHVSLAIPNQVNSASSGNYFSLTAFSDTNGAYQINNVPISLPLGSLKMTATATNATNATATLSGLSAGGAVSQNFILSGAASAAAAVPVIAGINSFTQPTDALSGSARQARLATTSVYEGLRRKLSPLYARLAATRKAGIGQHLHASVTATYAVETDVLFNPPAASDTNLLQYYVYRTVGAGNAPTQSNANFYDNLLDPQANYYTDLTFTSDSGTPYTAGNAYNFALSSLSTTGTESALSSPYYTITPLGPITLSAPAVGASAASPVTLTWSPVSGATNYYVYIYAQYPTAETTPFAQSGALAANTTGATVTLVGGNATYYALVVATADETETAGGPVLAGAAQSYSQITRFTVL